MTIKAYPESRSIRVSLCPVVVLGVGICLRGVVGALFVALFDAGASKLKMIAKRLPFQFQPVRRVDRPGVYPGVGVCFRGKVYTPSLNGEAALPLTMGSEVTRVNSCPTKDSSYSEGALLTRVVSRVERAFRGKLANVKAPTH